MISPALPTGSLRLRLLAITAMLFPAAFAEVGAQPHVTAADGGIPVIVRWDGSRAPGEVRFPAGEPFKRKTSSWEGTVPRPQANVRHYDVEVLFDGHEYPLGIRVTPQTDAVQPWVAIDQPKSCADVYLRRLEKPTTTAAASIKAAFTLGYMIDGRAGENSCDAWPLRAAKARFDRYRNAMERSDVLAIPEGVKAALRDAASTDSERRRVQTIIASGEEAERQKVAIVLQRRVLAQLKSGDVAGAHAASALLLETSRKPEFASAVASQIDRDALEKQTSDLAERAAIAAEQPETPQ